MSYINNKLNYLNNDSCVVRCLENKIEYEIIGTTLHINKSEMVHFFLIAGCTNKINWWW